MDSERIPCGLATGLASEYNNKKFLTLDSLRSLPQGISIRSIGLKADRRFFMKRYLTILIHTERWS
jgi:hypothetical protein